METTKERCPDGYGKKIYQFFQMKKRWLKFCLHGNRKEIILPLVQNLEGAVLGADVIKRENYWTTGDYPFSRLEEIKPEQFTLMQDKRIKTIIEVTKKLKEKPLILEAEAPFSILAALIDPMKLNQKSLRKY